MVAPYKPLKTVKYSPSYTRRPIYRPYERKTQKIRENFAPKVFYFLVFQLIAKRIYKTMTERKILY